MIAALLLGALFGFTLSIPPGPLALAFMKNAVIGKHKEAILVGLGAAVMDVFFNLLAAFASSAIVVSLSNLFIHNRWLSFLFQIASVIVLGVLGIRYLRDKHDVVEREIVERERTQEERARKLGRSSPFFLGTLIAFTNLATPTFLPSMVAVISYLHAEGIMRQTFSTSILYATGFGIGTMMWFFVILQLIRKNHDKISQSFITVVYKLAGGAFVAFALVLMYKVFTALYSS